MRFGLREEGSFVQKISGNSRRTHSDLRRKLAAASQMLANQRKTVAYEPYSSADIERTVADVLGTLAGVEEKLPDVSEMVGDPQRTVADV